MYWIEVDFSNGKTLRKQSEALNETYKVFTRYCCGNQPAKVRVLQVRAGKDNHQTHCCDHRGH
mgnify:CR=1 FL=1